METQIELLAAEILKLGPREREELVQLLVASLEDASLDDALAVEVERRNAEVDGGVTRTIPMSEAIASVRAILK